MNKKSLFMFICVLFVSLYSPIRAEISWKQKLANATNDGFCGLLTYCPSEKKELKKNEKSISLDEDEETSRILVKDTGSSVYISYDDLYDEDNFLEYKGVEFTKYKDPVEYNTINNDYDKKQNKNIFQHLVRIPLALSLHNTINYAITKNNIEQTAKKRCLTSLGVVITGKAFSVLLGSFDDEKGSLFGLLGSVCGGVMGGHLVRYWLEKEANN